MLCLLTVTPPSIAEKPTDSFAPEELIPLGPRSKSFRITKGDRRGELLTVKLVRGEKGPDQWKLHLGEDQVLFLRRNSGGVLYITRIIIHDEQKSVVYHDPLPLLPDRQGGGSRSSTRVDIYNLETGALERSGPVVHRVGQVSRSRFTVEAGSFPGYRIEIRQRIELSGAEVHARVEIGCAPGLGLVMGRGRFVTEKRFWFDSTTRIEAEWKSGALPPNRALNREGS